MFPPPPRVSVLVFRYSRFDGLRTLYFSAPDVTLFCPHSPPANVFGGFRRTLHPLALHPLALHPLALHPLALHPLALRPTSLPAARPCAHSVVGRGGAHSPQS
uniref:Uncharacterized protein n=1 Tax=Human betaherpesvirus 6 TaxID=10368 RepID=A0A5P9SA49_9BETA|nr:hypothetical protein [Human betaherpesvirus 6]QFV66894.1 hypothetical protein [Human betaherpesvirus 6]